MQQRFKLHLSRAANKRKQLSSLANRHQDTAAVTLHTEVFLLTQSSHYDKSSLASRCGLSPCLDSEMLGCAPLASRSHHLGKSIYFWISISCTQVALVLQVVLQSHGCKTHCPAALEVAPSRRKKPRAHGYQLKPMKPSAFLIDKTSCKQQLAIWQTQRQGPRDTSQRRRNTPPR